MRYSRRFEMTTGRERFFKREFTQFHNSTLLFYVVKFVKCWWFILGFNSKGLKKETVRKSLSCVHALQKT